MTTIHPTAFVHPTAVIGHNVTIEANVYIGPLCIIGFQPEWKGKEREDKGVRICEGARLTGLVTVDSGAERVTTVGKDSYLLKKSHVGHDAILKDNVTLSCNGIVGGHTIVGRYCNIGLGAILHQKIEVPDFTMIGMGGIVTKKSLLTSFDIFAGNPVKFINHNNILIETFKDEYSRYLQNRITNG